MCKRFLLLALILTLGFSDASYAQVGVGGIRERFIGMVFEDSALVSSGRAFERELDPATIKVLVWNIKKAEMPLWREEFLNYTNDMDLVLIQEAYRSKLFLDTIHSIHGIGWDMGVSFINKRDGQTATGTMIGSRASSTSAFVRHSKDTEHLTNTPKSMTFAKYRLRGHEDELLVISVHAINMTGLGRFRRHLAQAHEVIKKHKGPVIYAGDFNTWSENRLEFLYNEAAKLGLRGTDFRHGLHRMSFSDNFLDHAFVRGLRVRGAEVFKDSRGSDHRPLALELVQE
jgi:endonuclease/exonuclease/phosphatase (EEP) superfamily protein YafD